MSACRTNSCLLAIFIVACAGACYAPADSLDDSYRAIGGGGGSCSPDDCGENSAYVNGYPVDELHLMPPTATMAKVVQRNKRELIPGNLANVAGVRVTGFLDPSGNEASLYAEHGELYALDSNFDELRGNQLALGKILIDRDGVSDVIVINEYKLENSIGGPAHSYLLTYAPEEEGLGAMDNPSLFQTPVCKIAADTGNNDLTWAVITTKERYRHATDYQVLPSVLQSSASGWLNIACQGNALNKSRKWGYYPDTGVATLSTSPEQRQALLKSIVNDACGQNLSLTENGTPVAWHDSQRFLSISSEWSMEDLVVESIWTEHGATCLNQARLSSAGDYVNAQCPLPSCPDRQEAIDNLSTYGKIVTLVQRI